MRSTLVLLLLCLLGPARAELPAETLGRTEALPLPYPKHWFWAHDLAFHHMMDGKYILLNADGATLREQYKGMFNAAFVGQFAEARTRPEIYVSETYYSRVNRGQRSDVVTVYDKATLSPVAEIALPGNKRSANLPNKYMLRLINDEKFLLVYNFTAATSVGVIDIVNRRFLNEIPLPSCALMYPTGRQGFSSLCGNASMLTHVLNDNGQVAARHVIDPFFSIEEDALFEKPVIINGIGYFPTFKGNVQEIDLSGERAVLGRTWSLVSDSDRARNWRPGGVQLTGSDGNGRMYVIMHPDGKEGSHKDGGPEVWAYDVKNRKRVQRIELKHWGLSVELTRDAVPLMLIVNSDMNVDVYRAGTGEYLRTLSDFGQETPLVLHAVH